ncbi:DEAD/DEAH box helicase [Vibrio parahaemolyticus]|uniref:DEAD/DEAH box helicase n=1 Tax=Vibrio parahaemolyticus TaxID=670 RepID=A0AAW3J232_VIBPH|nr:DEAD/DEAH box helicase [Vibrio parahaemolyticus]EGQ7663325.1 DEAD/DEAH box helicase [Vibrio parahaemolyticus]EGQ7829477.1 DEAD/DEAH box helicase [Vibrio parahaemolyticus]EGQ9828521.1 DEAD/DEAH box helicase [Vibrio parahaemolyticus]EGR0035620.1 DEAD/DEAH box helicase [Vibrio parahaemolyticus]EGR0203589.1 DEAD/DEAH box helicase [Vibrio parahaemolyticus]
MDSNLNPLLCLNDVQNEQLSAFSYLKKASDCLSSPQLNALGREFLIRALDQLPLFEGQSVLLQNLLRKAGLFPYIKKYFPTLSPEKELVLDIYRSNYDDNFIFHSMQAKVFRLLTSGQNVVLSAPTSMGKSAIVDALIAERKFSTIVIVVPTIALIDETRRRIQKKFGHEFQIIHHGSQLKRKDKVIYILTQERVNERDDLRNIDLFIIDEFYKLAYSNDEPSRVIALNIALSKLLTISKQFYMIGPYIDAIRGMENLRCDYTFIPSEFNTVALNVHKYDIAANDIESKNEQLTKIVEKHQEQTIIYCKSATSIAQVAQFLGTLESVKDRKLGPLRKYHKWLVNNYGQDWTCSKALTNGIGIHHGALPRAIQQKSIDLFNSKQIKYLLCTSTMIEGVNTAAKNIVIYDNRKGSPSIDSFTHKNISGRAGRMNQYLVGNVFCLESIPDKEAQVVELPLGQRNDNSPINLLAGIQPDHLSDQSNLSLNQFVKLSDVPIEIIRNHSSYKVEVISDAYELITELSVSDMELLATMTKPRKYHLGLLSRFIKTVESGALSKVSLHFYDNDDLQNRLSWYIYADNHSSYIKDRIRYIYRSREDEKSRSETTDKELKIARNIFKHAVTRALLLLEELLNYEMMNLDIPHKADLGYLVHLFENSHLPPSFSALEEMGIPIETLEKLTTERSSEASIDVLTRYLRMYHKHFTKLSSIDHSFIKQAVY